MSKESFREYQVKKQEVRQTVKDNQHGANSYKLNIVEILLKDYSSIRADCDLYSDMQTRNIFWHI